MELCSYMLQDCMHKSRGVHEGVHVYTHAYYVDGVKTRERCRHTRICVHVYKNRVYAGMCMGEHMLAMWI